MRCPKCGYISFDKEEICGGCKKNITKFSQELSGVVMRSVVPDFLWFEKPEEEEPEEETPDEDDNAEAESDDIGFDMDAETEVEEAADADNTVEFAADADGIELEAPAEEESKEIEFDLSGGVEEEAKKPMSTLDLSKKKDKEESGLNLSMEDTSGSDLGLDSLDFDLDDDAGAAAPEPKLEKTTKPPAEKKEKAPAKPAKEPSLDLSGLDLSGLMPPEAEEQKTDFSFSGIGELSLEGEESPKKKAGGGKKEKAQATDALPDLSMDGLDLSTPILPPAASAAGKKMRPAAKTGTALDDFNVDLGDLLGGGGKKEIKEIDRER
ncbi:MAG: hypothetical protein CDV28_13012 [Candidatus Electronema aureum]|uniref:Uncharacterized protein n=1 Tax=Candidatus Electronema aureum TaxID=2005002 RepID=A0A521FZX5_9BACT|nr:MAG: hypothetical protein CDV28_13012 [Candidatus Electronema aureum]